MEGARVAADASRVHTPIMTLKNAALLALIGTILMTVEFCLQRKITVHALAARGVSLDS
jgi:hypothetical protein